MQSIQGIRFLPIARVDDMLLGLDARWLDFRGWGLVLLLVATAAATATVDQQANPIGLRLMAGLSILVALLLTSVGHELGHVVASRLAGLKVHAVVLAPQGGLTIHRSSEAPAVNFLTALAGPLANLLLGLAALWLLIGLELGPSMSHFLVELAALQLLTAAVNLLPLGTLDGQRLLSALRTPALSPAAASG